MSPQAYALIAILIIVLIIIIIVVLVKFSTGSSFVLPPSSTPPGSATINQSSAPTGGGSATLMSANPIDALTEDPPSNPALPSGFRQVVQSFNNVYFASSELSVLPGSSGRFLTLNIDGQLKMSSAPTTSYNYSYRNKQLIASRTGRLVGIVKIYGSDSSGGNVSDRYLITDLRGLVLNYNPRSMQIRFVSPADPGSGEAAYRDADWMPLYLEILRKAEK